MYSCHICIKPYTTKRKLTQHFNKFHAFAIETNDFRRTANDRYIYVDGDADATHFGCLLCAYHFALLPDLKKHYELIHSNALNKDNNVNSDHTAISHAEQSNPFGEAQVVENGNSDTKQSIDDVGKESGNTVEEVVWGTRKRGREEDALQTPFGGLGGYGLKMTEESFEEHNQKYLTMKNDFKWMLQSGRFVEDILYEAGKCIPYEHMFHSFAYDVDDAALQSYFSHEEINELRAKNVKEDPTLCLEMQELLRRLSEQSTCEGIRSILTGLAGRFGSKYDIKTDFDIKSIAYATEANRSV